MMESISTQIYLAYMEYKAGVRNPCTFEVWMKVQAGIRESISQWLYSGA